MIEAILIGLIMAAVAVVIVGLWLDEPEEGNRNL